MVIHTVKDFSIDHEAEVDVFLEFSCFFYGPTDDGNLNSGSSAFSKSVPLPDSQVGQSLVGPRTLVTVLERLWHKCCPVCGSSAGWLYGFTSQVRCSQRPCPRGGRCWPVPLQGMNTQCRSGSVSVGSPGPGAHKVLFEPSDHLWQIWSLFLNVISPLLPSCRGCSCALGRGVSFFGGIQHSPVSGYSAVGCNFGVLAAEDERMSFYSAILRKRRLTIWPSNFSPSKQMSTHKFVHECS